MYISFTGKHTEGNTSPSITWKVEKSSWWSAGLVFAFKLVLSLVIFILYGHPKPQNTSNLTEVAKDPESDNSEPCIPGSLLLLHSQFCGSKKTLERVWKTASLFLGKLQYKQSMNN